jgi:hypothetical protein
MTSIVSVQHGGKIPSQAYTYGSKTLPTKEGWHLSFECRISQYGEFNSMNRFLCTNEDIVFFVDMGVLGIVVFGSVHCRLRERVIHYQLVFKFALASFP